jgi:hypothetical protein
MLSVSICTASSCNRQKSAEYSSLQLCLAISAKAGPSGRAVYGLSLRPLACWDCGFQSHRRHGCLFLVSVVSCHVEVSATSWSLVQRSHYLAWCVVVCKLETSWMRRFWPPGGCCAQKSAKSNYSYCILVFYPTMLLYSKVYAYHFHQTFSEHIPSACLCSHGGG